MKATSNNTIYIIVIALIIIVILLLGGGSWMNGMMHGGRYSGYNSWNWTQILISIGIGFLIGWFVARRRR